MVSVSVIILRGLDLKDEYTDSWSFGNAFDPHSRVSSPCMPIMHYNLLSSLRFYRNNGSSRDLHRPRDSIWCSR